MKPESKKGNITEQFYSFLVCDRIDKIKNESYQLKTPKEIYDILEKNKKIM